MRWPTPLPNPREAVSSSATRSAQFARSFTCRGLNDQFRLGHRRGGHSAFVSGLPVHLDRLARSFRRMERVQKRNRLLAALVCGLVAAAVGRVVSHVPARRWVSLPALKGLTVDGGIRIQPEFYTLAIAIMTYGGAYIGEIVRGGFKAVGRGQVEAAQAPLACRPGRRSAASVASRFPGHAADPDQPVRLADQGDDARHRRRLLGLLHGHLPGRSPIPARRSN